MKIIPGNGKLDLKNDGQLELFFIGVGSAFAATSFQTNFLIIKGQHHILVDFGITGPHALRKTASLEATDINTILPTHSHADHVGGIEYLALINRYVAVQSQHKPKLTAVITKEYQNVLWDMTLRGGMGWNESDSTARKLTFEDYFDVIRPTQKANTARETWEVDVGPIHLEMFRTKHIPEQARTWKSAFISYGLFIDQKVFCSVDTRFDLDLINLYASRSEIMFHDVQFFPGSVHTPLADLKSLPQSIKSKMHLVHYSDDWVDQDVSDFAGFTQQGYRYVFD